MSDTRTHWGSRLGFILAAAGSAVGLGNMWKFPYITGTNGGGWFVIIYLLCIVFVGLPIMVGEILVGRSAQTSTVGAFRVMNEGKSSPWMGIGWMGVITAFVILSFYSVVAGWSLHYVYLALNGLFDGSQDVETIKSLFGELYVDAEINIFWHLFFMGVTIAIVISGVQKGVERAARILMPVLFAIMLVFLINAFTMEGFSKALSFVFYPDASKLTPASILEALGHSFFTLSVGMGAMLTYGSYLSKKDNIISASVTVSILDTLVALVACLVLFPITFSFGMEPAQTVGLIFINMPLAFAQMTGGTLWAIIFFVLLTFAALSSAISLLEVAASYFIDERGVSRKKATLITGLSITILGIPSALSGGDGFFGKGMTELLGKNWFDAFDYVASNWFLPLGGLGIAVFVAWRVGDKARYQGFVEGATWGTKLYVAWLVLLKYLVPIGITAVFLHAVGVL